jgi:regulator of sirC expression with transglutaminase-like and TPR domain
LPASESDEEADESASYVVKGIRFGEEVRGVRAKMESSPVNYLRQLLEEDPPNGRLDRAALELATLGTPDLEPEPFLDQLNEMASHLADRMRNFNDGRDFVETAQRYLFGELGFHGNQEDFFDPGNSFLNQVLERRTGIPITLSVMYMEIARRLAMPVFGIGLPRHFIIQFDDGNYSTYIDPYNGGRTLTVQECFALAGAKVADPILLRRASKKQIAMRMLQNLRGVYLRRREWARAIDTLDLLLVGAPELSGLLKQRGLLHMELKRFQAARGDLEKYLAMEPEAADRDEIRKQIRAIHAWLARVN